MMTKVLEREISDHQNALRFSTGPTVREIFGKNGEKLRALKALLQKLYSSSSIFIPISIKISLRSMLFYGSYRVRKKSIQVEL